MQQWQLTLKRLDLAKRVLEVVIVVLILLELSLVGRAFARGRDSEAVEQHRYIDTVLVPRFTAAWGEWAFKHPQDIEGQSGSHYRMIDAGDIKRGQGMRAAFHELDDRLKLIGY